MGNFTELDMYLFGQATHYDIYKKLGAHPAEIRKKKGILFDVWAPHAAEVYVIGTFNDWNETANPMRRLERRELEFLKHLFQRQSWEIYTNI